ncbi:putative reverse transcriptase domain-containing protein [Tanacetum coccineum]
MIWDCFGITRRKRFHNNSNEVTRFTILYYPRPGSLPVSALSGDIMDKVDIEYLTIEQYLRLTQESQTPKKIKDMTIAEYLEYEKKEFAHCFDPNQPNTESDYDSEDMEEEGEYMADDEKVMNEQEESNHGYTQNIQHFEEKDDVDEWLNAEITKHMSNLKPRQLMKEMKYLPLPVTNHNLYATATLDAKYNFMPQRVYEYLGLDKLKDTSTLENTTGTNDHLGTINILVNFGELEFPCNFVIRMTEDVIILGRPFFESTRA